MATKELLAAAGILFLLAANFATGADYLSEHYNSGDPWTNGAIWWARYSVPEDFTYTDSWTYGAKQWLDYGTDRRLKYYYFKPSFGTWYEYSGYLGGQPYSFETTESVAVHPETQNSFDRYSCAVYVQAIGESLPDIGYDTFVMVRESNDPAVNYYLVDEIFETVAGELAALGADPDGAKIVYLKIDEQIGAYGTAYLPDCGRTVHIASWPIGSKKAAIISSFNMGRLSQIGSTIHFKKSR